MITSRMFSSEPREKRVGRNERKKIAAGNKNMQVQLLFCGVESLRKKLFLLCTDSSDIGLKV